MEVTAPIFHDHSRISHCHHHRAGPWGARTAVTKPPQFLTDLTCLIEHHRLKYSLETQTTKSIMLFCKMPSSSKHNLLLHPLRTWELRTFPGTHSRFSGLTPQQGEEHYLPANRLGEGKLSENTACGFPVTEGEVTKPPPKHRTWDRNRERRKIHRNRWHWLGPS